MNRQGLAAALRKVSAAGGDPGAAVDLSFAAGGVTVSAKQERGSGRETVDASGEGEIKISFNPGFLTDVFRLLEDDQVTMGLSAPDEAAVVKGGDESYTYVVMPVVLGD